MEKILVLILILCGPLDFGGSSILFTDLTNYENAKCTTNDGRRGICTASCPRDQHSLLAGDICSYDGRIPVVCCPKLFPYIAQICEQFNPKPRVPAFGFVGGQLSLRGAHPHMAAIGWEFSERTEWNCGGSLVHPFFILTAAHCTSLRGMPPTIVRLGDIDLEDDEDNSLVTDYSVQKIIVHPEYNPRQAYNDIALLKIQNKTEIRSKPICIWTENEAPTSVMQSMGYGTTAFAGMKSNKLFQGNLELIKDDQCISSYGTDSNLPRGIISSQMCAMDSKMEMDTCQGDSGGPLQFYGKSRSYLVGITSFGQYCAGSAPGVYTRLSSYLEWIEQNLQS